MGGYMEITIYRYTRLKNLMISIYNKVCIQQINAFISSI